MSVFDESFANEILNEGLFALQKQDVVDPRTIKSKEAGNYLISLSGSPVYIGEAKNLSSRLAQQITPKTSTFFKNFQNSAGYSGGAITDFSFQVAPTRLGRKEIEDFGISNLLTELNKFQLGKRTRIERADHYEKWNQVQSQAEELIRSAADTCMEQPMIELDDAVKVDHPGIYIVRHCDDGIIYVGESSNIGNRLKTHNSATYFSAFRRNLATTRFGYELETRDGRKRYLPEQAEAEVNAYMVNCRFAAIALFLGRYEIEELLIAEINPVLNRKSRTSKVPDKTQLLTQNAGAGLIQDSTTPHGARP